MAVLVSVHMPKCAGSSFRTILRTVYGADLWENYGVIWDRNSADPGAIPPGVRCIHGHFTAGAFDAVLPNRRLITWVRHPVERVVSNYYFFLRYPQPDNHCSALLHRDNLSLIQFARIEWMQNEMTRYIDGKGVEAFDFVGIQERFIPSLSILFHMLDMRTPVTVPMENRNPGQKRDRYQLPEEDYNEIMDLNQTDLRLYQAALRRHNQEYARAKEVRFRIRNAMGVLRQHPIARGGLGRTRS